MTQCGKLSGMQYETEAWQVYQEGALPSEESTTPGLDVVRLTQDWGRQHLARAIPGAYWDGSWWVLQPPFTSREAAVALRVFPELDRKYPFLAELRDELLSDARPFDNATPYGKRIASGNVVSLRDALNREGKWWFDFQDIDLGYVADVMRAHGGAYIGWERGLGKTLGACDADRRARRTARADRRAEHGEGQRVARGAGASSCRVTRFSSCRTQRRSARRCSASWRRRTASSTRAALARHKSSSSTTRRSPSSSRRLVEEAGRVGPDHRRRGAPHQEPEGQDDQGPEEDQVALPPRALRQHRHEPRRGAVQPAAVALPRPLQGEVARLERPLPRVRRGTAARASLPRASPRPRGRDAPRAGRLHGLPPQGGRAGPAAEDRADAARRPAPAQRKAYDDILSQFWTILDDGQVIKTDNVLAQLTKLRQIATGLDLEGDKVTDSTKLDLALEMIRDNEDEAFVVFTWYKANAKAVAAALGDDAFLVTGDVPHQKRART
jgi:hypothetical protein